MKKPELLLPAGNAEMFHAALEGGADAVYLGIKRFNAREKAENFSLSQLPALLDKADQHNLKIYLTLNTVIKNQEIPELIDTLYAISQTSVSAIIIQDWGVYYLARHYFNKINLHASTQMGNHNSLGGMYSQNIGFERVIFARELTQSEISDIRKKSDISVELFVHGALCYSFSGMCLFSSYLGGMSANRGMCMQPCRRMYNEQNQRKYLFSLKDHQLIEFIPEITKLGISSLKVEGRLKSAEYVYQVARAYRLAIDQPEKTDEAKKMLHYDMGRPKSSYFFGGKISGAFTENPSTGIYIGKIIKIHDEGFTIQTSEKLQQGNRVWIRSPIGHNRKALKLKDLEHRSDQTVFIHSPIDDMSIGDLVYLANLRQKKFSHTLMAHPSNIKTQLPKETKKHMLNQLFQPATLNKTQIFVRIDSIRWLKKIPMQQLDNLIINLSKNEWEKLDVSAYLLKKNAPALFFELPKFIAEKHIPFYQSLFKEFRAEGYKNFMISHLSQKLILPDDSVIASNENVYVFNDAAIRQLLASGIKLFCYPLENDMENLKNYHNKKGIVPLYYYPELFYSRMPVSGTDMKGSWKDDKNHPFKIVKKNGMNIVIPQEPVALTQYKEKLEHYGFGRFLVDFSYEKPSDERFHSLIQKLKDAQQTQPSSTFNYKRGLT